GPKGTDVSGIAKNIKKESSSTKASEDKKEPSKEVSKEKETKKEVVSENKSETTQTTNEGRIFVSPLAKVMAEEKGIDLRQVIGSGENGRIVKSDIENYQPAAGGGQAYIPVGTESFEEVKNSQMRKTIAKRLAESKFTAPEYYLTVELDMDHAIAAREAINADPDVKISFN